MFRYKEIALTVMLMGSLMGSTATWAADPQPTKLPTPRLGKAPRLTTPVPEGAAEVSIAEAELAEAAGLSVTMSKREDVRNFYNAVYQASENVASQWTGDIAACSAGSVSSKYKAATLRRVNYFRAMAGVPANVALYSTVLAKNQAGALMMSANSALSHTPPSSWACYTADGADAADSSNIALGMAGADAIDGYMFDDGSGNTAAGHRRWILYPQLYRVGTGDVTPSGTYSSANTLWVLGSDLWLSSRPSTRSTYVAWPPAGYMPKPLVPTRWSFAYPGADFSNATVSMSSNGTSVSVTKESVANGYGDNTLVWQADLTSTLQAKSDTPYTVVVNNVVINGTAQRFQYVTKVFDPTQYGSDTVLPNLSGPTQLTVGAAGSFTAAAVSRATGYQWRSLRAANDGPYTYNAESGLGKLSLSPSASYSVISTDAAADGTHSYHLAQENGQPRSLVFSETFVPKSTSVLTFASRLGLATTSQTAKVQVSVDDGVTWRDLYSQAGGSGATIWGETSFTTRTVSLKDYANKLIRLRFYYGSSSFFYLQTDSGSGWYVDSIQLKNVLRVAASTSPVNSTRTFSFTPKQAGTYFLAARALAFGKYPLEWGGWKQVTVTN